MVAEFVGDEVFTTARNKFEISYPKINFHFFFHSIGSDWFFAVTKGSSAGSDFNLLNDDFEFYIA